VHPRLRSLRLVAITDSGDPGASASEAAAAWSQRVGALARQCPPGALLIQVRAKSLEGGQLAELARSIVRVASPHGALVMVNARLDVALAIGADGVHLPERGLPLGDARALGAAKLIVGCSRHDAAAAARAVSDGADLVQLGPIWSTPSKEGMGAPLGEAALTAARGLVGDSACLVAVGGIEATRAKLARAAGAHAVAAIRAAWADGASLL
jgi:thiamine-phosphate pyrophosphorylase